MPDYKLAFKSESDAVKTLSNQFGRNDNGSLTVSDFGFVIDMIGHEPHRTGKFDDEGNEITTPRIEYLVNVRTQEPNAELDKLNRVVLTPVRVFQ
jgi:hypothetical protein